MIHTGQIYLNNVDKENFWNIIRNGTTTLCKKHKNYDIYINNTYKDSGIILYLTLIHSTELNKLIISARINFLKLLNKQNDYTITADDKDIIYNNFNLIISNFNLPELEEWCVSRIDYSVNIRTEYVKEYIKLFHKAKKPYHFRIPLNDSNNRNHRKGSLYYYGKSYNINFYDKEQQLIKKNKPAELIKNAKNILRIEVQCKKGKTDYLKAKNNLKEKKLIYFLNPDYAKESLIKAYKDTIGTGDFYKLDEIFKTDNISSEGKKYIAKYRDLLSNIGRSGSINNYLNKIPKDKRNNELDKFRRIRMYNVNVITISQRECVNYLPCLLEQIEKAIYNTNNISDEDYDLLQEDTELIEITDNIVLNKETGEVIEL